MHQLSAFLFTLLFEAPAGALAVRVARSPRHVGFGALAAVLGSCVTHPFVWWLNETYAVHAGVWGWTWRITLIEGGAALVEAVGYGGLCALPARRALAVSVAVNAFSFAMGLTLRSLGLHP